jgi:hypothetical protein
VLEVAARGGGVARRGLDDQAHAGLALEELAAVGEKYGSWMSSPTLRAFAWSTSSARCFAVGGMPGTGSTVFTTSKPNASAK